MKQRPRSFTRVKMTATYSIPHGLLLTTEEIMSAANWSSKGTFQKFLFLAAKSNTLKSHFDMAIKPSEV